MDSFYNDTTSSEICQKFKLDITMQIHYFLLKLLQYHDFDDIQRFGHPRKFVWGCSFKLLARGTNEGAEKLLFVWGMGILGLRRRLSPLLSLLGWTAATTCSPVGTQCRGKAHLQQDEVWSHNALLRDGLHWLGVPFHIECKLCLVYLSVYHFTKLLQPPEYLFDCTL